MVSQQMMDSRWGVRESGARIPAVRECFVLILRKIYSASCKETYTASCKVIMCAGSGRVMASSKSGLGCRRGKSDTPFKMNFTGFPVNQVDYFRAPSVPEITS